MDSSDSLNHAASIKEDRITSFRASKWTRFDPEFAQMIKEKYPSIWALGGNIRGNDQFRKLYPITQRNGVANSDLEINALELREAWVARHYEDFRIAGVIAQIKWLAVGSRGEQYMKNLVKERMKKVDEVTHATTLAEAQAHIEHFGVKGMQWGVRNDGSTRADRKAAKKDTKFVRDRMITVARDKRFMRGAEKFAREGVKGINSKPEYQSLFKSTSRTAKGDALYKKYVEEHRQNWENSLNAQIKKMGKSETTPSGRYNVRLSVDSPNSKPQLLITKADQSGE